MSLDFFNTGCQEAPRRDLEFGICDPPGNDKAHTTIENAQNWIATVKNETAKELVFTAIDKCVLSDAEYKDTGRCDGMLSSDSLLYLIELKDARKKWRPHALDQLESTINLIEQNHPNILEGYEKKGASVLVV